MDTNWIPRFFLLTLTCLAIPQGRAAGVGVDSLLSQSDAVVVAAPTSLTVSNDGIVIRLAVTSWLAGESLSPAGPIDLFWNAPNDQARQGFWLPAMPEAGIWFLKDLHNGSYSPIILSSSNAPVSLRDLYLQAGDPGNCASMFAYSPSDQPVDKIAMVSACAASSEVKSNGMYGGALRYSCGPGDSNRVRTAAAYLAQMPASRQKAIGIGCLLGMKDSSGMALLDQNLQELDQQDMARLIANPVLGWTETDPAGINSLGRVAVNPRTSGTLLKFAAYALASIHTLDTLPWHASMA